MKYISPVLLYFLKGVEMSFSMQQNILSGIRQDDEVSWQQFFIQFAPLVRLAGRDCRVPEMYLDDLVQNVFMAVAADHMKSYDPDRGNFCHFFRGIIRNKAYELLRSINRQEKVKSEMLNFAEEEFSEDAYSAEWVKYVKKRVWRDLQAELPQGLWEIFELLYLRNWSVLQVSQHLKMPQSTVYVARKRIQKKCRTMRCLLE